MGWSAVLWDGVARAQEERLRRTLPSIGAGSIGLAHEKFADPTDLAFDGPAPEVDHDDRTRWLLEHLQDRALAAASLGSALTRGCPVRVRTLSAR